MWPFAKRRTPLGFSDSLTHLIRQSRLVAIHSRNDFVGAEHLLMVILAEPATSAARVLDQLLVSPPLFALHLEARMAAYQIAPDKPGLSGSLPLTKELEQAFHSCRAVAREMGAPEIEALHLLPPLLAQPSGAVAALCAEFGLTFEALLPLLQRPAAAPSLP